jgi:hypothetical protein
MGPSKGVENCDEGGFAMGHTKGGFPLYFGVGVILGFLILLPLSAPAQEYPATPITIYCGYAAGASTDVIARALGPDGHLGIRSKSLKRARFNN